MADKTRNNGEWTESRFHSFVKSGLRSLSQKWPPKYRVLGKAYAGTSINPSSGRLAKRYECASCKNTFTSKDVEVNHIEPVVPISGFDSWDNIIERLFCEESGLEVVCKPCHKVITKQENISRKNK
jgi:5-methylcytosine-specific restriction endonuclease McrA